MTQSNNPLLDAEFNSLSPSGQKKEVKSRSGSTEDVVLSIPVPDELGTRIQALLGLDKVGDDDPVTQALEDLVELVAESVLTQLVKR